MSFQEDLARFGDQLARSVDSGVPVQGICLVTEIRLGQGYRSGPLACSRGSRWRLLERVGLVGVVPVL